MSKRAKYLLFTLYKLIEYLPLFFSELARHFLLEPILAAMSFFGATEKSMYAISLRVQTLPSPPPWLVLVIVAFAPSLLVAFSMKNKKAVFHYFLFATGVDLVLSALAIAPYLLGLNHDLIGGMVVVVLAALIGMLLAARTAGLATTIALLKIHKSVK